MAETLRKQLMVETYGRNFKKETYETIFMKLLEKTLKETS